MSTSAFSLKQRIASFRHAINGMTILFREEHNAWIHVLFAFCVLTGGLLFRVSAVEWVLLVLSIALVISLEVLNSALENVCDAFSPERHPLIKKAKDLAAAAVLISAMASVVVGLIIFIPKILALW